MSNVQTSPDRDSIDLDHFVYSCGSIGRLKTLSCVPVVAGDSISVDAVGAFRLSPLRRGLSVDSKVELFSFYIPHRHTYGQDFVDMMKTGIPKTGTPTTLPATGTPIPTDTLGYLAVCDFLGTKVNNETKKLAKYLYEGYKQIYNNYFKNPYQADVNTPLASNSEDALRDGFSCSYLESLWSKPLTTTVEAEHWLKPDPTNGLDIIGLNQAYAELHTQQERDHFMQRYRDVMSNFGGSTHYDADNRPHLLMHHEFWGSGYDVDGTTQETLGQFSGRVQQPFSYHVPRFYVPEHGAIWTLALVRFPSTNDHEMHYLAGKAELDYRDLACDPVLVGNSAPRRITTRDIFAGADAPFGFKVPEAQWYRFHPSHVDARYHYLKGFPFHTFVPQSDTEQTIINVPQYDAIFQTSQLGHWNIQSRFNVTVHRRMPSARDSIMTS